MVSREIREKLSEGCVINAPGVLNHLRKLGFNVDDDLTEDVPSLWITPFSVNKLCLGHQCYDAKFLLPQDILDIPIPEPEEPIITEWDYQVGDVVEIFKESRYGDEFPVGTLYTVIKVDAKDVDQPIRVSSFGWPEAGCFKLVKKAERKITVEMSKETYESLKDSLRDAEVVKS